VEVHKLGELNDGGSIQVDYRSGIDPDPGSDLRRNKTGFLNWHHGNIKPAHIFRFTDKIPFGTLKLADLGRAKRHDERTSYRPDIENDKYHTKRYQFPDILLYLTTSRL
jgi:hypothetical protein